jgi:hypothetical protein
MALELMTILALPGFGEHEADDSLSVSACHLIWLPGWDRNSFSIMSLVVRQDPG